MCATRRSNTNKSPGVLTALNGTPGPLTYIMDNAIGISHAEATSLIRETDMKIRKKRDLSNRNKFHVWMCNTCAWSYSFDIDKCPRCEPDSTLDETSLSSKIKSWMFTAACWGTTWSVVIGVLMCLIFGFVLILDSIIGWF